MEEYILGSMYGVEIILRYEDVRAKLLVEKDLQQLLYKKYPSVAGQGNKKRLIAELKKAIIDLEV